MKQKLISIYYLIPLLLGLMLISCENDTFENQEIRENGYNSFISTKKLNQFPELKKDIKKNSIT